MIDLSKLRRYDQECWYSSSEMEERPDGEYVRFLDVERLLAELEPVGYVVRFEYGAPLRTNQSWTNGTAKLYKSRGTATAAVRAVYPRIAPPGMNIAPVFAGVPELYKDLKKAKAAKPKKRKSKR